MSFVISAVGNTVTGFLQADAQKDTARAQGDAANRAIDEQRRQFDAMQALFAPFVQSGSGAIGSLAQYQNVGTGAIEELAKMSGLRGNDQQLASISGVEQSPLYQGLVRQGEEAVLQNASATGGLRGGNIQDSLANFRSNLLNELIAQQYARYGNLANAGFSASSNLAQLGQGSAAGQAAQGQALASNLGNLYQNQAQAKGMSNFANAAMWNTIPNAAAQISGGFSGIASNLLGGRFS